MSADGRVVGVFLEVDTSVRAIEELRAAGLRDLEIFSPLPQHEMEHALHVHESPVRLYTLVGGLTGAATGFALPIWTSLDWPLITGGKPIISLPPFVIIAFELTILFGALATVLGLLINARLGKADPDVVYDPSFSNGRFGVLADVPQDRKQEAMRIMQEAGAEEVRDWAGGTAVEPTTQGGA